MAPPEAKPPRWISFDCYGTLIDWEEGVRRAGRELGRVKEEDEAEWFATWERMQWEKIREPYRPYAEILRETFRHALEEFGYLCPGYATEAFVDSVSRWEPFPDVAPALRRLSPRYRLAIISNIDRDLLGRTLRHFPVRFDALIAAEDARAYKPHLEIFRFALARLGCFPADVAHVAFGAEYDLAPASAIGLQVVYLNRRGLPRPNVPLLAEIQSLEELPQLWDS